MRLIAPVTTGFYDRYMTPVTPLLDIEMANNRTRGGKSAIWKYMHAAGEKSDTDKQVNIKIKTNRTGDGKIRTRSVNEHSYPMDRSYVAQYIFYDIKCTNIRWISIPLFRVLIGGSIKNIHDKHFCDDISLYIHMYYFSYLAVHTHTVGWSYECSDCQNSQHSLYVKYLTFLRKWYARYVFPQFVSLFPAAFHAHLSRLLPYFFICIFAFFIF